MEYANLQTKTDTKLSKNIICTQTRKTKEILTKTSLLFNIFLSKTKQVLCDHICLGVKLNAFLISTETSEYYISHFK
jgi:hypothetical protein